ncbi:hypothetical protein [Pseudomonas sp.]|uniref:hypothetical protein n=1 Tax=Pseudomonas sp. TaxID=306 RepID=UPI00262AA963|nr:hypothetical protein [Pseudomonas sp.]
MQLLKNHADWRAWAETLAGVSIAHRYNVPAEPAAYPCHAYAVVEVAAPGFETEAPRYLYRADLARMQAALLEVQA